MHAQDHEYHYYLPDHGETEEDARSIFSTWEPSDAEGIALACADDWHRNGSGWESEWPNVFVVLAGGQEIGRCHVGRETVPEFYIDRTVPLEEKP